MAEVLLGIGGSVACYRACDVARELMRQGHNVHAVLTRSAAQFIQPVLLESLTGNPCLVDVFDEPERGMMAHIDLARKADLLLIAPATASLIGHLAHSTAEDMLTSLALAFDGPICVAPAMNPSMLSNPGVQENLTLIQQRGMWIVDPETGLVACGEEGSGKLASNSEIVEAAASILRVHELLKGKKVLITSGPTHEPLDGVRFIGNRSSGRMGCSVARAALLFGAEVVVVSGPVEVAYPARAKVLRVSTAQEMHDAAVSEVGDADWVIGVAAVADYRPAERREGKIPSGEEPLRIELAPNPDVIASLAERVSGGSRVVAFAAEHGLDKDAIRRKMERKGVWAIVVNDISNPEVGFESSVNEVELITDSASHAIPRASKDVVAIRMWDWLLQQADA